MSSLVSPADLADFPGAPHAASVVDAAAESVRAEAGWHIAPTVTETLTLDGVDGTDLVLPSLRVIDVTEIRDVTEAVPVILSDWRLSASSGIVRRIYGWPWRAASIEVDIVHGHPRCPTDLLPEIAARCLAAAVDDRLVASNIDDYAESYRTTTAPVASPAGKSALAHHSLSNGFA